MKIALFAGALRRDSLNKKLAREAARLAAARGHAVDFIDLQPFALPVYDGDIEAAGMPAAVGELSKRLLAADALIVSTPEYNGSIPGSLKNTIDWLSRVKPVAFADKPLLLLAASPGALGGVRSLWHTRQPFEVLGAHVFPDMLGVPKAHEAFDEAGLLKDPKTVERLQGLLDRFLARAARA
jgi:chromate reductase, NAD(P)H dehydrogenase (quinone)